jgi:hypothetical protein
MGHLNRMMNPQFTAKKEPMMLVLEKFTYTFQGVLILMTPIIAEYPAGLFMYWLPNVACSFLLRQMMRSRPFLSTIRRGPEREPPQHKMSLDEWLSFKPHSSSGLGEGHAQRPDAAPTHPEGPDTNNQSQRYGRHGKKGKQGQHGKRRRKK